MAKDKNEENPLGIKEPKTQLAELKVSLIRESSVALRSVQRSTEAYQGLVDSVRDHGVLNPILVREDRDAETGTTFYWLIDGLQRFSATKDSGRGTISAKIVSMDDAQVLEAQIITNVHKIETKPVEYSKQLLRIMAGNPTMTAANLASRLKKSPSWISERLGLVKLAAPIAELVDNNQINLSNAYALAKLPPDEQGNFTDRAMTLQPQEFVPQVNARVKEIRDAKRQGRDAEKAAFQPVAHLQKLSDIKSEMASNAVALALVSETGVTDPIEAFNLAIQWTLHLDPLSIKAQIRAEDERVRKLEEAKTKRQAEASEKKALKAAETGAAVSV